MLYGFVRGGQVERYGELSSKAGNPTGDDGLPMWRPVEDVLLEPGEDQKAAGWSAEVLPDKIIRTTRLVDLTAEEQAERVRDQLAATDREMGGRPTEDLYDLLLAKGFLVNADIPQDVQDRIAARKALRAKLKV
jgi:hypothetical protein